MERMEDDGIVLLRANNGDVGAEMELQAAENSSEGQGTEGGEDGTDAGTAARTAVDPMDRDPAFIVYVAAITAAVGGLLFGYDMGTVVNNFNDGGLRPSLCQLT